MRTLSAPLAAHLLERVTTLAWCWRILRCDGVMRGFTSHDGDLRFQGQLFRATPSLSSGAIGFSGGFAPDSLQLTGALTSGAIDPQDLRSGLYDGARVEIFLLNWADVSMGPLAIIQGTLGDVSGSGESFQAELRGMAAELSHQIVPVTTPECRATLGDAQCQVAVRRFTTYGQVTSVTAADQFSASDLPSATNWFAYGRLRWLTGANAGRAFEVYSSTATGLVLRDAPPNPIVVGQRFEVTAGCDKRLSTCADKFQNQVRFRGEPHMPGFDAVVRYAS
jgi:uncharacterized phage protein (TIGR02218 family)